MSVTSGGITNGMREGQDHFMRNAMLTGGDDGMITLERSLATLVRERLIDRETALRTAIDPVSMAFDQPSSQAHTDQRALVISAEYQAAAEDGRGPELAFGGFFAVHGGVEDDPLRQLVIAIR